MTLVEKMARAHDREEAAQRGEPDPWAVAGDDFEQFRADRIACFIAAFKAIKPSEDMIETIAGEMDVAMQMEFNAVFAKDLLKRMARSACFALVNAAILQQNQ